MRESKTNPAELVPVGSRRFQEACLLAVIKVTLVQNDPSILTRAEVTEAIAQLLLALQEHRRKSHGS